MLHIEDSVLFQEITAQEFELAAEGFDLRHAETLSKALSILESWTPDVVLTDLWLPDSEGRATYEAVRVHAAESQLVVLTGSDTMLLDELLGSVANPVFQKDDVAQIPALVLALARRTRSIPSSRPCPAEP